MNILYGIVGEGMGHATRSRVVLDHLLALGHVVRVVVSGRAHQFLLDCFAGCSGISIQEIHGLSLDYEDNALDLNESILRNLEDAPKGLLKNIAAYTRIATDKFMPDFVISDFESWSYLYGLNHQIPVVSIDNMQIIHRCSHASHLVAEKELQFQLTKFAVKMKLLGAYHYLITTFFVPKVRKKRTTLIPPILRPEILSARREPMDHILVYQTSAANEQLLSELERLPFQFYVYGMGKEGIQKNIHLKSFSQQGFVNDLRTAKAVVAGGGFSLMGEAVHLGIPMLSIPIRDQFEQELNARYLAELGFGSWAPELDVDLLIGFLNQLDRFVAALSTYRRHDNTLMFDCIHELTENIANENSPPQSLNSSSLGSSPGGHSH